MKHFSSKQAKIDWIWTRLSQMNVKFGALNDALEMIVFFFFFEWIQKRNDASKIFEVD